MDRPTAPAPAMATFIGASMSSLGGSAAMASASAMCPAMAAMYTWSPAWMTVFGSGSRPAPKRIMNATRPPVAASRSVIRWPTQSSCSASSVTPTLPVGSRHLVVSVSRVSTLSSRSVVHGTVATVGMPSRS